MKKRKHNLEAIVMYITVMMSLTSMKCSYEGCNRRFHKLCTGCFRIGVDAFKYDGHKAV